MSSTVVKLESGGGCGCGSAAAVKKEEEEEEDSSPSPPPPSPQPPRKKRKYAKKKRFSQVQWRSCSTRLGFNPVKQLFSLFARREGLEPVQLYRDFFSDCISAGAFMSAVSNLDLSLSDRYFGTDEQEPKYCSITDTRHLAHLSAMTGRYFTIYQQSSAHGMIRLFDNRVFKKIINGGVPPQACETFILHHEDEGYELHLVDRPDDLFEPLELSQGMDLHYAEPGSDPVDLAPCYLAGAAQLLGKPVPQRPASQRPWTLEDLCCKPQAVWDMLGVDFAVVVHVGTDPWKKNCRRPLRPYRNRFRVLSTVYNKSLRQPVDWSRMAFMLVNYQEMGFVLGETHRKAVMEERRKCVSQHPSGTMPAFPHGELSEADYLERKKKTADASRGWRRLTPCNCNMCKLCVRYEDNLDARGSQKLYTVDYDLFTYLKIFNLSTAENLSNVRKSLRLSVSGMDLETSTLSLEAERCPVRAPGRPYEKITRAPAGSGEGECLQRILLIGHTDEMEEEDGGGGGGGKTEIFETPRNPAGVKTVVHDYIRYVLLRQYRMELRKRLLLAPLLHFVAEHKAAFWDYFEGAATAAAATDERGVKRAWRANLLGRFEDRLERLCKKYYVEAFNGSGFDLPLLCAHIATSPWLSKHWRIQRNGSSVTQISLPSRCIYFRDLKKMLAPGFSLASLAATVGLADVKFKFPYGILRGYGEVLDEARLPDSPSRWFDTLSQSEPSQAYVDEALAAFDRLGCSSVRDYLVEYLRMDLKLLLQSCHLLLDKFTALTGVSPIDCDKSTLSSYSMYCSQMKLALKKRPGAFCNNNPAIYNTVKNSLRGGLTMVTRTSVNEGESEPLNEPHLEPGDEGLSAAGLLYLDVSGLYSAAGLEELPFGPAHFFWLDDDDDDYEDAAAADDDEAYLAGKGLTAEELKNPEIRAWLLGQRAAKKKKTKYLRMMPKAYEKNVNQLSHLEMIWVQWYMLERARSSSLVCASSLHAGPGQIAFGSSHKHRADLTVVQAPGEITVVNFHGSYYHYAAHDQTCPLGDWTYTGGGGGEPDDLDALERAMDRDTSRDDEFKLGLARALTAVGHVNFHYETMTECELFHGEDKLTAAKMARAHGDLFLAPPKFSKVTQKNLVSKIVSGSAKGFVTLLGGETKVDDKVGSLFSFCQQLSHPRKEDFSEHTLEHIAELCGEDERLVGKKIDELCSRPLNITRSSFDSEGGEGHTLWSELFKWLVEKRGLSGYKIVHFVHYNTRAWFKDFLETNLQERWRIRKNPALKLDSQILKLLNNGFYGYNSIQATSFSKSTVSSEKSLMRQRGRYRNSQSILLLGSRDKPHSARTLAANAAASTCRIGPDDGDRYLDLSGIARDEIALRDRGLLAQDRTRALDAAETAEAAADAEAVYYDDDDDDDDDDESSAGRRPAFEETADDNEDDEEEEEGDLLYLITRKNDKARLLNLQQISGCILGLSKVIFYEHIRHLLQTLDLRKAEICYLDTDSVIVALASMDMRECVEAGQEQAYDARIPETFVDEESERHQTGKLKLEMKAKSGLFRSVKTYHLTPLDGGGGGGGDDDDNEPVFRAKGVAKINQKAMDKQMFHTSDAPAYANRYKMAPDKNLNVSILFDSRKLATSINLKRLQQGETGVCSKPL